ncbi:PH domain-containing protein [Pseudonocardia sichuanensis]|uniref:PH (Pleckstrin Homology) domain-containing protein n=1 Tax=Pseudonocardia kunmingensis TaxID=630975 RepID=A0A543E3K8_9PSEU|nr:PH domain-containing protein [Pseudonocardia kunmingensis]TQM16185.1 PH (Pleckstrin Homology) domain-containing protein [Pseudonocardia kunmingensis]
MSDHDAPAAAEWSPAPGLVVLAWLVAVGAAAWCVALWVSDADPAGRLLAGVAAVGATTAALFGTRARPRLRADPDGLTVGGLLRSRHHPWPFVAQIRVLRVRRLGRETSLLEVDTVTADGSERLLVFGRLDLAADPEDVAPRLHALRP